jgi:two-component system sensor histidine kinase QseC
LDNVVFGCDRAAHLVDQLLTLARLDPAGGHNVLEPTDVHVVARSVLAQLAPAALAKFVDLELGPGPADAFVRANPALVEVLLRNLMDNAVRYSPPGTTVRVKVESDSAAIRLVVVDQGPGVPQSELERLGERFHRLPGVTSPGSGLGLSIVRCIADIHGASVRFSPAPDGRGLEAVVVFPRPK